MEEKYRAILEGAEYPLQDIESLTIEDCRSLGVLTATMTKGVIEDRDRYKESYEYLLSILGAYNEDN